MIALFGIFLVLAAVLGGFLLGRANPYVLMQSAELLIIGGAAVGIALVAKPPPVIRRMWTSLCGIFRQPRHTPASFLRYVRLLYELLKFAQPAGIMAIEEHIETPERSSMLKNSRTFWPTRWGATSS